MSVISQAFVHAINHIESLMKLATAETKKAISEKGYSEDDYFVISLELTDLGYNARTLYEGDNLDTISYHSNVVAIFVDEASKFLSWENPTESDIKAFKDMLVIKLEQAEKYDTLADRLAEQSQTRNIIITDEDLEQSTLASQIRRPYGRHHVLGVRNWRWYCYGFIPRWRLYHGCSLA